ncbi:MAG TPA: hypothetical protein VIY49_21655 [Bryobacteraceae bacterium]
MGSTLGVEHLDAREIRMQNGSRCIEDSLVQLSRAAGTYQLRCDALKPRRDVQLCLQALPVLPQRLNGRFESERSLPEGPFRFWFHFFGSIEDSEIGQRIGRRGTLLDLDQK